MTRNPSTIDDALARAALYERILRENGIHIETAVAKLDNKKAQSGRALEADYDNSPNDALNLLVKAAAREESTQSPDSMNVHASPFYGDQQSPGPILGSSEQDPSPSISDLGGSPARFSSTLNQELSSYADSSRETDILSVKCASETEGLGCSLIDPSTSVRCVLKFKDVSELEKHLEMVHISYGGKADRLQVLDLVLKGLQHSTHSLAASLPSNSETSLLTDRLLAVPAPNFRTSLEVIDLTDSPAQSQQRTEKFRSPFQCKECSKSFTRKFNLTSHMMSHVDDRRFACAECGRKFVRRHDQKIHEALHSKANKFVCRGRVNNDKGCGREFTRASALKRHWNSNAGRRCVQPVAEDEPPKTPSTSEHRDTHITVSREQMQSKRPSGPRAVDTNYTVPGSLLAQYPELKALVWESVTTGFGIF
ncbi:hypothetical protein MMC13_007076 [Lambiella insularis]|nr:hypothetical protein [Lambiella insularis]